MNSKLVLNITKLGKGFWHKTNCFCNHHIWRDREFFSYNYLYRSCIYCGKQQCKGASQIRKMKWYDIDVSYETDTQKIYKKAKKLSENAVTISNELAKFDSYVEQKTKTFMHLVNAAKQLSKEYIGLKEEIRKLHIKKQRYDIETLKGEGIDE